MALFRYYMLLIAKASVVGEVGYDSILKVEEVSTIYVPSDKGPSSSEEQRYLRTFQSVDLSTNFYFCLHYDLSRTLQGTFLAILQLHFTCDQYAHHVAMNTFQMQITLETRI